MWGNSDWLNEFTYKVCLCTSDITNCDCDAHSGHYSKKCSRKPSRKQLCLVSTWLTRMLRAQHHSLPVVCLWWWCFQLLFTVCKQTRDGLGIPSWRSHQCVVKARTYATDVSVALSNTALICVYAQGDTHFETHVLFRSLLFIHLAFIRWDLCGQVHHTCGVQYSF